MTVDHRKRLRSFVELFWILLFLPTSFSRKIVKDFRVEEFNRVNRYETISVQLSNVTRCQLSNCPAKILKFEAFGTNYDISLYTNTRLIASKINSTSQITLIRQICILHH